MYNLFDKEALEHKAQVLPPGFAYLRNGLLAELEKVRHYYMTNVFNVSSDHLVVSILQSLGLQFARPYQYFADAAADEGLRLSMVMRLSSPLSRGQVRTKPSFYPAPAKEIIFINSDDFDVDAAVKDWKDLRPIRVLRHPFTDLSLGMPNARYPYKSAGVVVVQINTAMLAIQYRRWCEVEKYGNRDDPRTVMQFVATYPIPNMLYSHTDLAVFNRMVHLQRGLPVDPFRKAYPINVIDYSTRVDVFIQKALAVLMNRTMNFSEMLSSLPMISAENLFQAMQLPDCPRTKNIIWVLILSRLPLIRFLLKMNYDSKSSMNRYYLSRIAISINQMRNDQQLAFVLSDDLLAEIEAEVGSYAAIYL